jgi:uncharacterized protein YutE (UPF0331/DUF86 family)
MKQDTVIATRLKDDIERLTIVYKKIEIRLEKTKATNDQDPEEKEGRLEALAYQLQAFYTGLEAFFEKALASQNIRIQKGESSHAQIVEAAQKNNLLPCEFFDYVRDLTKFRHRARHGYGQEIQAGLLLPKAEKLPEFWKTWKEIAERLIDKLKGSEQENEQESEKSSTDSKSGSTKPANIGEAETPKKPKPPANRLQEPDGLEMG